MDLFRYVLITPARNEAALIEGTIKAVVRQTELPAKWVIVSDGSTDGTDDIVRKYVLSHPWIELLQMPQRRERHFAGKAYAFNTAYATLANMEYEIIGNLDADVTFDEQYFEFLLRKFAENPRLGVAGTPFCDESRQYDYRIVSLQHVSGCCQLFRRSCFEEVGGYIPSKLGGVDLLAVTSARMRGWRTRTFLEKSCIHHRKMGTAQQSLLASAFQSGRADYVLGCGPLWQLFRSIYRMAKLRPVLLSGIWLLAGYSWEFLRGAKKVAPDDLIRFRRAEERSRLIEFFKRALSGGRWKPEASGTDGPNVTAWKSAGEKGE
jgi:glycosyltransferase involved in cell wall biosynthesis